MWPVFNFEKTFSFTLQLQFKNMFCIAGIWIVPNIIKLIQLSGEIWLFFCLKDLPRYKSRRPDFREVVHFRDHGVANSGLDVVHSKRAYFAKFRGS
jgi:hypothetical protein